MTKTSHDLSIIILAAGKGTRMKSELPKVMHKVAGREMLNMVIDEAEKLAPKNITIVVSDEMKDSQEKIISAHKTEISFALQKERKGTAHAVQIALASFEKGGGGEAVGGFKENKFEQTSTKSPVIADAMPPSFSKRAIGEKVLVLYGDTPLIKYETLIKIVEKLDDFSLCVLGFDDEEENAYGRLVVDEKGHIERIVEFKDANDIEQKIALCNSGVMAIDGKKIKNLLAQIKNNNAPQEFYLTDIVAIAGEMGLKRTFIRTEIEEVLGVNSRGELAKIEEIKQNQIRKKMMAEGVTLVNPASVQFSFDTKIENDTLIHPNVVFGPKVVIEKNVEIKSFCHIEGAQIASGAIVGPFARIRPETKISENVRIGNFVEVKKSQLKRGAKVNHLSYIGDAEIGEDSNIGAGTITCNYDGYSKSKTKIGKNVFVGSNTALIAPVEINDGALIAAGSTITKNVEKDDLAVARSKQISITAGGKKFRETKLKK